MSKLQIKKISVILVLIISILMFNKVSRISAEEVNKAKEVLILHSYSRDYAWTEKFHEAIINEFNKYFSNVKYRVEYMDSKNYMTDKSLLALYQLYEEKYENINFDIIIATDNNALNFLIEHKNNLFGDIPVVASGINNVDTIEFSNDFYIVEEKPDYKATIDLALNQNKEAKNLYFILDNTTTSVLVKEELEAITKNYEGIYNINFINKMNEVDTKNFIATFTERDLIFYVLYFQDADGTSYRYDEIPRMLSNLTNRPVYTFWDFTMNTGALGGKVSSAREYGKMASKKAFEILTNSGTTQIVRDNGNFSEYMFDYNVVKKQNLSNYPNNSHYENKPLTYFEKHREVIITSVIAISILLFIIFLLLKLLKDKVEIEKKNKEIFKLNKTIMDTQKDLIATLGDVIETKSEGTANHVKRVAKVSRFLAKEYGLSEKDVELIELISPMHDVGKIGISEEILHKPARLTEEEYATMKFHTTIGHELLSVSNKDILNLASMIALQHHERWDGNGYPHELKGDEIHVFSRITSIADVYDALRSKRPYKESWDKEEVVKYFKEQKGKMFDPELTQIFLDNIDILENIRDRYSEEKSKSKIILENNKT